ncbi:MAG: hypothetical protein HZA93_08750 [Verrucomicrobia bacterium]|nr:hypothetical protein [Verrucomicrobiota bacterium]
MKKPVLLRAVLLTATVGVICLTLAGCDPRPPSPVNVDAPQLASSLKWVGCCAVASSALGAIALIIASRNRNRRK